jgi:hypothetical protein
MRIEGSVWETMPMVEDYYSAFNDRGNLAAA